MKFLKITALALLLVGGVAGIAGLKARTARLRAEADEWRQRNERLSTVRGENRRLRTEVEAPVDAIVGIMTAAGMDRTAGVTGAARGNSAPDPMPLDAFRNVGRATPQAAFQTAIWASVKGDASLRTMFDLSGAAREKAEAVLSRLPASSRAIYGTPEDLVGVFFSAGILVGTDRFQILGDDVIDPTHSTVRVRTGAGREDTFPMTFGADGWCLVVPERALTMIDRILKYPAPPSVAVERGR